MVEMGQGSRQRQRQAADSPGGAVAPFRVLSEILPAARPISDREVLQRLTIWHITQFIIDRVGRGKQWRFVIHNKCSNVPM